MPINAFQVDPKMGASFGYLYDASIKRKGLGDLFDSFIGSYKTNLEDPMRKQNTFRLQKDIASMSNTDMNNLYGSGGNLLDMVKARRGTGYLINEDDKGLNEEIVNREKDWSNYNTGNLTNEINSLTPTQIKNGDTPLARYNDYTARNLKFNPQDENLSKAMTGVMKDYRDRNRDIRYAQIQAMSQEQRNAEQQAGTLAQTTDDMSAPTADQAAGIGTVNLDARKNISDAKLTKMQRVLGTFSPEELLAMKQNPGLLEETFKDTPEWNQLTPEAKESLRTFINDAVTDNADYYEKQRISNFERNSDPFNYTGTDENNKNYGANEMLAKTKNPNFVEQAVNREIAKYDPEFGKLYDNFQNAKFATDKKALQQHLLNRVGNFLKSRGLDDAAVKNALEQYNTRLSNEVDAQSAKDDAEIKDFKDKAASAYREFPNTGILSANTQQGEDWKKLINNNEYDSRTIKRFPKLQSKNLEDLKDIAWNTFMSGLKRDEQIPFVAEMDDQSKKNLRNMVLDYYMDNLGEKADDVIKALDNGDIRGLAGFGFNQYMFDQNNISKYYSQAFPFLSLYAQTQANAQATGLNKILYRKNLEANAPQ